MGITKIIFMIASLSLVACKPVDLFGDFSVKKKIILNSKVSWGKKSTVTIPEGVFRQTELTLRNGAIDLAIKSQGKVTKVTMKGARLNIPQRSGKFSINRSKIGQNRDVRGNINYKENTSGNVEYSFEACSISKFDWVCSRRCGERKCCNLEIDKPGVEKVAYERVNYSRKVDVQFIDKNQVVASFEGTGQGSDRRFLHIVEDCRESGPF